MLHLSRLTSLALTIALIIGAPMAFADQTAPSAMAATTKAPLPLGRPQPREPGHGPAPRER
mgnify:CR=1 FL=1